MIVSVDVVEKVSVDETMSIAPVTENRSDGVSTNYLARGGGQPQELASAAMDHRRRWIMFIQGHQTRPQIDPYSFA